MKVAAVVVAKHVSRMLPFSIEKRSNSKMRIFAGGTIRGPHMYICIYINPRKGSGGLRAPHQVMGRRCQRSPMSWAPARNGLRSGNVDDKAIWGGPWRLWGPRGPEDAQRGSFQRTVRIFSLLRKVQTRYKL